MGIATVAVYSDADLGALFVRQADEAIAIGPAPSSASYLRIDGILAAAQASGADAIHPGYGFLSENAEFAQACTDAGILFIGPSPAAIALLGSKEASKALVADAGVPVLPSYSEEEYQSFPYPVLLKASAGGGGKGMQIVRNAEQFKDAMASARRIAKRSFADDTILIERYIEAPRHIEIQILADHHGNLVHLYERECSIQRRHQKIIEESPAPNLAPDLRDKIAEAALRVAKAANYRNAGTVEFIVASDASFYFLEVNTRLQVEHPVTEAVTGIDLVREQIRIAQGEPLGYCQNDIVQSGAAIECRLYAEDCENDFLPCSGTLLNWDTSQLGDTRVDTGVVSGAEISMHYDPLIAKLITHGPSRSEALSLMTASLAKLSAIGVVTNRRFLMQLLRHPAFEAGELNTDFIATHRPKLHDGSPAPSLQEAALLALAFASIDSGRGRYIGGIGFRNNRWREERLGYILNGEERWVGYFQDRQGQLHMRVDELAIGQEGARQSDRPYKMVSGQMLSPHDCELVIDGYKRSLRVFRNDEEHYVLCDGFTFIMQAIPRFPLAKSNLAQGSTVAPMPATVTKVLVQESQTVCKGDTLLILEAMKMEHKIASPHDGTVRTLLVNEGDQVQGDQVLVVVAPTPEDLP